MKVYEFTLKPLSGFGTPLKGDTIFGHICWQAVYDPSLFGKGLDELLLNYMEDPFLVVSTAYPVFYEGKKVEYALKKPDLPLDLLFDFSDKDKRDILEDRKELKKKRWMLEDRKELKKKRWMIVNREERITSFKALTFNNDDEIFEIAKDCSTQETKREVHKKGKKDFIATFSQMHNTIKRTTGTTGEERFAPFSVRQRVYFPETELVIFIGISDGIDPKQVEKALERIGAFGFGKDASTGLGKFEVCNDPSEIDLNELGSDKPNACYTLSPSVPEKGVFKRFYFTPFTRFGRHGDYFSKSSNPFKNPVIMADEGAIFLPKNGAIFKKPHLGVGISDLSKVEPKTVMQGYSLYIPVRMEDQGIEKTKKN